MLHDADVVVRYEIMDFYCHVWVVFRQIGITYVKMDSLLK